MQPWECVGWGVGSGALLTAHQSGVSSGPPPNLSRGGGEGAGRVVGEGSEEVDWGCGVGEKGMI